MREFLIIAVFFPQRASTAEQGQAGMATARKNANTAVKEALITAMKTVLCLAQADVPNVKTDTMIDLQVENHVSITLETL